MKVLVVGAGGREHALVWKIALSPIVTKVYCAPGNGGTAQVAENVDISAEDIEGLCAFAIKEKIDLTVIGPEVPLAMGIVDLFESESLAIFGPSKSAARLEGSKAFMKQVVVSAGVDTARYEEFTDRDNAVAGLDQFGEKVVIKADGLAAGKGVIIAESKEEAVAAIDEILGGAKFGTAGNKIVIEEFLEGEEASILAFCDGKNIEMMPPSQDHKQIYDGDKGPNTGGMGAYSPAPIVDSVMAEKIKKEVMEKVAEEMRKIGAPYKGILYAGLMIKNGAIKVLEFNCRFGDPECQPVLKRMTSDLVPLMIACIKGELGRVSAKWSDETAVCVVMSAGGYPESYNKGDIITGIDEAGRVDGVTVFHAGTRIDADQNIVTNGGRVLGVTATDKDLPTAIKNAYCAVKKIRWPGAYYRKDIGQKGIART